MPSFTSVSDPSRAARATRAAWLLLAGCAAVAIGVEATARVALDRSSKIQRRMVQEYRLARSIGADGDTSEGHLLVVGNSLLDEGVDFARVQKALAGWDARRFMVEQTYYYDWYYGLKRLLREGAHPDVVAVMLSVGQWMPTTTRGDYSAQYLFSTADLPDIARDLSLHPTQATDMFFSNISKFWGARAEMRNFVLGHTLPDIGHLMELTQPVNHRPLVDEEVERAVSPRIERLKRLLNEHGSQLVLVIPPMLDPSDGAPGLARAAKNAAVTTLVPVTSGAFGPQLYRDGFHLNTVGASAFTERLIPQLQSELGSAIHRTAAVRTTAP
jgi:hypothetical protein